MINFTYNKWLACLAVIGFLAAALIGWQRHEVEEANSTVEIIMAYDDIVDLATLEGVEPQKLFRLYKEAGLTSLAVSETTLEKLHKKGKITALSGASVLSGTHWQKFAEAGLIKDVKAQDVYILADNKEVFAEVKADLERRLSPDRVKVLLASKNNHSILSIKADYEKVMEWNLGLSAEELKEAAGYGFYVVPRPSNYTKVNPSDIEAVFDKLSVIDREQISAIVFTGSEVLGHPDLLSDTAQYFKSRDFALGLIEHPVQLQFFKQDGLIPLASLVDYNAIRLYVIFKGEQLKLDVKEAVRRHANTCRERNVRLNLLRSFETAEPGKTLLETNVEYVALTKEALLAKGFKLGRAQPYQPYFAPTWLLAIAVLGISAASVILLSNIIPLKPSWQYALLILAALILIFPILKGAGTLARQVAALASVCVIPILAVASQVGSWQKRLCDFEYTGGQTFIRIVILGAGSLILASIVSLAGGIYAGAVLSDIRFFLEIEIFRGVKLSFVAPLILITLVYLASLSFQNDNRMNLYRKTEDILKNPVLLGTLLLFGVAALALWIFLGRSGHTAGVPVPGIELKLRFFLEETLYARPRGKEFLIGHPAFLLLLGAMRFKWRPLYLYVLLIAATIGQSSIAETFAHMRTPIYMSIIRGIDGLALGMVIALIALSLLYAFMRFNPFTQKERGSK